MEFGDFMKSMSSDPWSTNGRSKSELLAELNEAKASLPKLGVDESPFEVGDIVTVREDSNKKGHGLPFEIIDVFPTQQVQSPDGGSVEYYNCFAVVTLRGMPKVFPFHHTEIEYFES